MLYQILELESGVSWEQVKQAYKELALVWHPDRFTHNRKLQLGGAMNTINRMTESDDVLLSLFR